MQRWLALGCGVVVGNSDFWIFFSPVFLTFCLRTTVEGGLGKHYRRARLKDVGIRGKGDVCSTRVWTRIRRPGEDEGRAGGSDGLVCLMGCWADL